MLTRHCLILLCLLRLFVLDSHGVSAQTIPNGGFESWTSGKPDAWQSTNDFIGTTIAETLDAHGGVKALRGSVTATQFGVLSPYLTGGPTGTGFHVDARPGSLRGWYKLALLGQNKLTILFTLSKSNPHAAVGLGSLEIAGTQSVYTEFAINVLYVSPDVPDTCFLSIALTASSGDSLRPGSTFILDDVSFGPATGVDNAGIEHPASFALLQNYPNPFNPETVISYQLSAVSDVKLVVYDMLGRKVAILVDERQSPGVYRTGFNGASLSSGTYFCRLSAFPLSGGHTAGFLETRKMQLLK